MAVALYVCLISPSSDDDLGPRTSFKGIRRQLGIPEANCLILGETHAEIKALVATVMDAAKQHGDENVLCIFDENMDNYKEGE